MKMKFYNLLMRLDKPMFIGLLILVLQVNICKAQQIFIDSGQRLGNSVSWDVKLGDLDGNGYLDAVVANYDWNAGSTQKNEIWLNNGDGTFVKSPQEFGSTDNVALFDINNDGHLDIIEGSNNLFMTWLNDEKANFTLSDKYFFYGNSILFDKKLNNDDQYEVITLASGDSSSLLRFYSIANGNVVLKDSIAINNFKGNKIAIGDLNNDGYSDIVLGQQGPTYILLNNKNGGFTLSSQKLGNFICSNIYLADVNADGFLDILQCNYYTMTTPQVIQPVQLYLNDGTGNFTEKPLFYNSSYITRDSAILDLDNDGDLDIYLNHGHRASDLSHKSEILFNDGHGNFMAGTVNLDLVPSTGTAFGDLDNDGDLDAFLACGTYLSATGFIMSGSEDLGFFWKNIYY